MTNLTRSLSFASGTAVTLNIVIGAGLLVLPGLVIKVAGDVAVYAWVFAALVAAPLLCVFIVLGRNFPNAGGIAHFAGTAFGPIGYVSASLIFLGAVVFGLPSIALTGGYYANTLTGASPHLTAAVLIAAAGAVLILPVRWVARANTILAAVVLCTMIVLIAGGFFMLADNPAATPTPPVPSIVDWPLLLAPFMMIFFAFTGWEVAAGLAEEFNNPERDFPLAMMTSFVVAVALYISFALLVQRSPTVGNSEVAFANIAHLLFGWRGSQLVAVLAIVIVLANLSGALWAVSRLVYSLSREGWLPAILTLTQSGTPWVAVLVTAATLEFVTILSWWGLLDITKMLALAGQNFVALYALSAVCLFKMIDRAGLKILGLVTAVLAVSLVAGQGSLGLYPMGLFCMGAVIASLRSSAAAEQL